MLLAIDIGNTSIDIGVFREESLLFRSKISSSGDKSSDEFAIVLNGIFQLNGLSVASVDAAVIASVVTPLTSKLTNAISQLKPMRILEIGPGVRTGLNIRLDSQTSLGADIVANCVAAMQKYSPPMVVIDVGTTTAFEVIGPDGSYEGGIIAPGVRLSLDALSAYASALPDVSIETPKRVIAKSTHDAMNSGVLHGNGIMIDGLVEKIRCELGCEKVTVVMTGGLADVILPFCSCSIHLEPNLTLDGLRLIYEKNSR